MCRTRKSEKTRVPVPLIQVPSRSFIVATGAACRTKQLGVTFPCCWYFSANPSIVSISLVNPKKKEKSVRGEGCSDPFLFRARQSMIISRKAFQFQVCTLLGTNPWVASFSLVKHENQKGWGLGLHGPTLGEVR